jgi:hypothetical protein
MSTVKHMRRMSDFKPVHYVVAMLADMPMPSDAELKSIVAMLEVRVKSEKRLRYVSLALSDVQDAIDDAAPAPQHIVLDLSCEDCGGSGVNRHNGSGCIGCGGRGEVAA